MELKGKTAIVTEIASITEQPSYLICNSQIQEFRLTRGQLIQGADNEVTIDNVVAKMFHDSRR